MSFSIYVLQMPQESLIHLDFIEKGKADVAPSQEVLSMQPLQKAMALFALTVLCN